MEAACHRQVDCLVASAGGRIAVQSTAVRGRSYLLRIALCSESVDWQVCFSSDGLPDIVFDDLGFQPLVADYGKGSSVDSLKATLRKWDIHNCLSLTKLMQMLLDAYREFHIQQVKALGDARLVFEVDTVGGCPGMHVLVKGKKVGISLPMDSATLLAALTEDLRQEEALPSDWQRRMKSAVRLELSFTANASASSVPTTAVSVQEPLKTWVGHLSLPSWTSQMCTVEYAERSLRELTPSFGKAAKSRMKRMQLIRALAAPLGRPLELDTLMGGHSSHNVSCNGATYLMHVRLSPMFPDVAPNVRLQRVDAKMATGHIVSVPIGEAQPKWSPVFTSTQGAACIVATVKSFIEKQ